VNVSRIHAALVAGLAALALPGAAAAADQASQGAGQWASPLQLYTKVCAHCHESGVGPVIKGINPDPAHYVRTVREGRKAMPPFRTTDIDDAMLQRLAETLARAPKGGK